MPSGNLRTSVLLYIALLLVLGSSLPAQSPAPSRIPTQYPDIFEAVYRGDIKDVSAHLANGTDANLRSKYLGSYVTPLITAAVKGHVSIANLLITHGADVNDAPGRIGTPLHGAILGQQVEMAGFLIKQGAHLNDPHRAVGTPLYLSELLGYKKISKMLRQHGGISEYKGDYLTNKSALSDIISGNCYDALSNVDYIAAMIYLDLGANVNWCHPDRAGLPSYYLLMDRWSIDPNPCNGLSRCTELLQRLITSGADLTTPVIHKTTGNLLPPILHQAIRFNPDNYHVVPIPECTYPQIKLLYETLLEVIIQHSGNIDRVYGDSSALGEALRIGRINYVAADQLLAHGAKCILPNPTTGDSSGWYGTIRKGKYGDLQRSLLEIGRNIGQNVAYEQIYSDVWPSLHYAVCVNNMEAVKALVDAGYGINELGNSSYRRTPLHWAALLNRTRMARYILDLGADVNLKDRNGKTAEEIARKYGHWQVASLIREHVRNNAKMPPLRFSSMQEAVSKGSLHDIKRMLSEPGNREPGNLSQAIETTIKMKRRQSAFLLIDRLPRYNPRPYSSPIQIASASGETAILTHLFKRLLVPKDSKYEFQTILEHSLLVAVDNHQPGSLKILFHAWKDFRGDMQFCPIRDVIYRSLKTDDLKCARIALDFATDEVRNDIRPALQSAIRTGNNDLVRQLISERPLFDSDFNRDNSGDEDH